MNTGLTELVFILGRNGFVGDLESDTNTIKEVTDRKEGSNHVFFSGFRKCQEQWITRC